MKQAMRDVALGVVFVAAHIYLFRFLHTFPTKAELRMWWVKELPSVVLNVAGWWLWVSYQRTQSSFWKQAVAWLGLIGNAVAICLPLLAFRYDSFVFTRRGGELGYPPILPVNAAPHVEPALHLSLILSVVMLALGLAAPRRVRLPVVLGGFASAWLLQTVVAL